MSQKSPYYPIFIALEQRLCLVVGGGAVAWRKIEGLLNCGAQVIVVAPKLSQKIEDAAAEGKIDINRRIFAEIDLEDVSLVYAATDDAVINAEILTLSRKQGILAAAVDKNWANGDFITPACFTHAGVTVAVSSDGESCGRSRDVKNELQRFLKG
ncbi:MAG: bifunctional precorrin-2 dehydrogenase/sirohydrochlorin ferrochelatase [Deltaproteobacteria bacterium]|nr:bifunctional precorrin-2 dehydrogenase/sirohydrochlorin ferrochelatase [Candidatus Tharpella sp.]